MRIQLISNEPNHIILTYNPLPDDKILERSNLKQSADDNFKFNENSRKFSKWVGNTVGIGEIARYEQFLLFPQCFQKACFLGVSKGVIVWECVKWKALASKKFSKGLDNRLLAWFLVRSPTGPISCQGLMLGIVTGFIHG